MTRSTDFRRALLRWYHKHGRDLPWRRTRDPYAILVSEFMLQQTQVATVLPYYREWLRQFPDFGRLARASAEQVLRAWQGLGYYARARNLHATAKIVAARHGGRLPKNADQLEALPGVGRYTANAIRSFSCDEAAPIVEANTARVLSRVFNLRAPIDSMPGRRKLWQHAASILPRARSAEHNSALLDLGALICLPKKPKCDRCPVRIFCRAKNPQSLPAKRSRLPTKILNERHALIRREDKILLQQSAKRWRGMWILPPTSGRSAGTDAIYESVFPFTNHRITLSVFRSRAAKNHPGRWFSKRELGRVPIPSPHRRAIEQLTANA